jgi:putative hydrolase
MAFTAMELGHEYQVLTDHSPRLTVANGLSVQRLKKQLTVVDAVNEHLSARGGGNFTLLKGIEVDILDDGSLDQTDEMLDRLDVRVASVHSKLRMDKPDMTKRMVAAVRNPRVNVLGHCTGRMVMGARGTRQQSQFDAKAVFTACVESNTAVEINSRPERRDPPTDLLELARDLGCLFSIDSDAHAPGQLDFLWYGAERAEAAGIDPDRIVNTWPKERLLAWANSSSPRRRAVALRAAPGSRPDARFRHGGRVRGDREVEVRRSKRRRRTVSAYRDGEKIVVLIPAYMTRKQEAEWVETMVARVQRSERR